MGNDRLFLDRAVDLAKEGIYVGGGPFGAVIVRNDKIVSEAYNMVVLNSDPTAHAEVLAIREAALVSGNHNLGDCTLYTSCEPCPMCLGAIYWAHIQRVVYACNRKDAEKAGFIDKQIYDDILNDPGKRIITFKHIGKTGGKDVFNRWKELGNKTPY